MRESQIEKKVRKSIVIGRLEIIIKMSLAEISIYQYELIVFLITITGDSVKNN